LKEKGREVEKGGILGRNKCKTPNLSGEKKAMLQGFY